MDNQLKGKIRELKINSNNNNNGRDSESQANEYQSTVHTISQSNIATPAIK